MIVWEEEQEGRIKKGHVETFTSGECVHFIHCDGFRVYTYVKTYQTIYFKDILFINICELYLIILLKFKILNNLKIFFSRRKPTKI